MEKNNICDRCYPYRFFNFCIHKHFVFAVQPIGAIPEGATFIMWKKGKMSTFESPDGLCIKVTGGVSLMCRSMMLRAAMDDRAVLFKMPYIKSIYLKSTGGKEFDR